MTLMHAPGNVKDLSPNLQQLWTSELSKLFVAQANEAKTIPTPNATRTWFFDAATEGFANTAALDISWTAFPRKMKQSNWAAVDQGRNFQEEYCEWEVARGVDGKVVRVTFTTETRDYYDFLWVNAPQVLLQLYQKFVSPSVQLADLGSGSKYNPQNRWNWPTEARGALMHMGQVNNTLGAAVNLAAQATWPVVTQAGVPVISEQELIAAIPFGDAGRHSDPHIGAQINELVRAGNDVSFGDPPGLYIDQVDLIGFETPDNSSATALMRVTRGTPEFKLRVVFEAPPGAAFVLGDVRLDERKITTGSQIAEKLKIRLRGVARPANPKAPQLMLPNLHVVGQPVGAPVHAAAMQATRQSGRVHIHPSMLSPE